MPPKPIARLPLCPCLRFGGFQRRHRLSSNIVAKRLIFPSWHLQQKSQSDVRLIHATPCANKKKSGQPPKGLTEDDAPVDLAQLQASLDNALTKLKEELSKLRPGGRFNPEIIENLKVRLNKESKEAIRLGDIAQCVPRGRVLNIIASEKPHIKPITSAIQSSDLSLTPQQDPQNPLQLNIQLPPTTTESRKQVVQDAVKIADSATNAIRNARAVKHKQLRGARNERPDELTKATNKMEKIVADANAAVKKTLESAKKSLESG